VSTKLRDFKKNSRRREEKQNNVLTFLPSYSINYYKLTESDFLILLENKKERKQNKKNKSY